jgi:hypothetical protein
MGCCGKNRKKKSRREKLVKYTGTLGEFVFKGRISGRQYRFLGHGARLEMDRRDFNSLQPGDSISAV